MNGKEWNKNKMLNEAAKRVGMVIGRNLMGKQLKKGMKVLAYYNSTNCGVDIIEIMGVTDDKSRYGNGGIKFDSVMQCLESYGLQTLKGLETLQDRNEYGYASYLWVKDIDKDPRSTHEDNGPWYYLYEGRWSRGSGAEALTFVELVTPEYDAKVAEERAEKHRRNLARIRASEAAAQILQLMGEFPDIVKPELSITEISVLKNRLEK